MRYLFSHQEVSFSDYIGWTNQYHFALPAEIQGTGRRQHAHRTLDQPTNDGGRGCAGGAGAGTHGLPCPTLIETYVESVAVYAAQKRDIGSVREARVGF